MKLRKLKKRLSGDHDFKGHTILGSMCTEPHPLAVKTYKRFLSTNIGDPGLFPRLVELEDEYILQLGTLLHNDEARGQVVTGGSEANILALRTARAMSLPSQREVIIPETSHFSFDKAADLLGLELIKIPVDSNQKVRVDLVEKALSTQTMAIVAIAGTTGTGVCDPVKELSDLAVKHKVYLHVDAAFGGFVFPFLDNPPLFDFRLPGVMSVTLDPHKMGRAVIQSGCIIYRNREIAEKAYISVGYLSGGKARNSTILGTRSGASVAAAWMIYNYLGFKGYKKGVDKLMGITHWFAREVQEIPGMNIKVKPECNIVGIKTESCVDFNLFLNRIRQRGWAVSEWSDYIRITIMPHVRKKYLKKFLKDIREISADIRNS